jgi:hypothetical protein
MEDRVRKNVAFNLLDPDEKALYNHAMKRTNFSGYVKRLIQRDMEGGQSNTAPMPEFEIDTDAVQAFI